MTFFPRFALMGLRTEGKKWTWRVARIRTTLPMRSCGADREEIKCRLIYVSLVRTLYDTSNRGNGEGEKIRRKKKRRISGKIPKIKLIPANYMAHVSRYFDDRVGLRGFFFSPGINRTICLLIVIHTHGPW